MRFRLSAVLVMLALVPLQAAAFDFAATEPKPVPEITFFNGNGEEGSLADFRGQVVVLNLWATWCGPCRREMPSLDRLQAQYGGEDLQVLPLSVDRGDRDQIQAFYDELGIGSLGIYHDPKAKANRTLRAPGLPTTVVIDRAGREVGRVLGHAEWDSDDAIELLQAIMAQ